MVAPGSTQPGNYTGSLNMLPSALLTGRWKNQHTRAHTNKHDRRDHITPFYAETRRGVALCCHGKALLCTVCCRLLFASDGETICMFHRW